MIRCKIKKTKKTFSCGVTAALSCYNRPFAFSLPVFPVGCPSFSHLFLSVVCVCVAGLPVIVTSSHAAHQCMYSYVQPNLNSDYLVLFFANPVFFVPQESSPSLTSPCPALYCSHTCTWGSAEPSSIRVFNKLLRTDLSLVGVRILDLTLLNIKYTVRL